MYLKVYLQMDTHKAVLDSCRTTLDFLGMSMQQLQSVLGDGLYGTMKLNWQSYIIQKTFNMTHIFTDDRNVTVICTVSLWHIVYMLY